MRPQPTKPVGDQQASSQLRPDWWAFGLAMSERSVGAAAIADSGPVGDQVRHQLARWRSGYRQSEFGSRLAVAGLDEQSLLRLLDESQGSLAARVTRPGWVNTVEQAVRTATALPAGVAVPEDWREALAVPLRPFVTNASADLVEQVGRILESGHGDVSAIADGFATRLRRHLVRIAARTLVHEINTRRQHLAVAIRDLAQPAELARLLTEYPVLARLLGQASRFATEAALELLTRFAADRTAIIDTLLDRADPGPVVAIDTGLGDAHRHGRSVAILTFADGRRVVYKPRDMTPHIRFTAMIGWLNRVVPELALRTASIMTRPGYGWMEFIDRRPLADAAGAGRFYRRYGALLALLQAVHAADIHYQNLLACGDQPVLVDMETLFHPSVSTPNSTADPATSALGASVQRTGLLPSMTVSEHGAVDVSGLGGDRGQISHSNVLDWELRGTDRVRLVRRPVPVSGARNRPWLEDHDIDVAQHEKALFDGFRRTYDAITRNRTEFIELITTCADIEVRIVVRNTRGYTTLLDESTQPQLLRDALVRDQALDLLWTESTHHRVRWNVSHHELTDLWAGDVPLFGAVASTTDVLASGGQRIPNVLDRSGLACALDRISAMSEVDRRDQEWIITAALAIRRCASAHDHADPAPGPLTSTAAPPERLLAAACAIADQIVARSMANDDRVNWLGLELVDGKHWMVLPIGAGLANGYPGVALFLAQLAELTGVSRYRDMARQAIAAIPPLYTTLAAQPDLVAAVGPGGLHGFGGIAYALARLTTLLGDGDLGQWTRTAVNLAATAAVAPGSPGWATGTAGCLAAMTAVHTELGLDHAAQLARGCAERVAEVISQEGPEALPSGFADGDAGIGFALARFAADPSIGADMAVGPVVRPAMPGTRGPGVAGDVTESVPGWCMGTAGLLAANTAVSGGYDNQDEQSVRQLTRRPVLRDLSLCHGELGIADMLTVLARRGNQPAAKARRRRAGLILDAIIRFGPTCGTPGGVSTPGLLTGLAGIGYGLLRLGFAERVPSVLLLEPTPRSATRG